MKSNPKRTDLLTRRKAIVEHPFGTIKLSMDQGYFLMKGIPKTSAEISLSFLAYNVKRVINILGVPKMIEPWGDPGLFLSFTSFGGQSIGIRRYSQLELRICSLLAAFLTVWRVVMPPPDDVSIDNVRLIKPVVDPERPRRLHEIPRVSL